MLFDEPPIQNNTIDNEEVWSAIQYLDPDHRVREASDIATVISLVALLLVFVIVWVLLWFRTM